MEANAVSLLSFIKNSPQFTIPIFQRTYSWTEVECRQLWNDIVQAGSQEEIEAHFIGSIVYVKQPGSVMSRLPQIVIDGQQRLTTISLIIEALARKLSENTGTTDDELLVEQLRNYYLLNPYEKGEKRFKLLLTQTDRDTLISIITQNQIRVNQSIRLQDNFKFFQKQIESLKVDLLTLHRGLERLMVVEISLWSDRDDPQLIYESLNSTGRELSQADLIRNFVLMGQDIDEQERLYDLIWRPMEELFGQKAYGEYFDAFIRDYLTIHTGELPTKGGVYQAFKLYVSRLEEKTSIETLVGDIYKSAQYYCCFALRQEKDSKLSEAFSDLHDLKADVVHPMLLCLYEYYESGNLSHEEMLEAVRLTESYVFRRAVCDIPAAGMNKTFAALGRELRGLDGKKCLERLKARFLLYQTYKRFPSDEEFCGKFKERDLYNFMSRSRNRSYWLRRLENHSHDKERVLVDECTIEHIMPQNIEKSDEWKKDLGEDWERIHYVYLHTLGNLTLTGYNSEIGNKSFSDKCKGKGNLGDSPLWLNYGLNEVAVWNEAEIVSRAERLAKEALEVWPYPYLPNKLLESYRRSDSGQRSKHSIKDFRKLNNDGFTRKLFDTLSEEIKAIDKSVREEFTKHYIAYKAETNFVDIEPQMKRLSLIINLGFLELSDRKKMAKDVTGRGKLGNGDVKVILEREEDIPYVMSLIRQAFDKQTSGSGLEE